MPSKNSRPSKTQQLHDRGFDLSHFNYPNHGWTVRCSQCEALVINGVACHETGCPNSRLSRVDEDEE